MGWTWRTLLQFKGCIGEHKSQSKRGVEQLEGISFLLMIEGGFPVAEGKKLMGLIIN